MEGAVLSGQAAARSVAFFEALRGMDPSESLGATGEVELVDEPLREDLGEPAGAFQGLMYVGGELARADLRLARLRVHRHDAARLVTDEVHDGVCHLTAPPVALGAAENDDLGAHCQLVHPPGLVEKDNCQPSGRVTHHDLDHRSSTF